MTIANGLAAAINSDTSLQTLGVTSPTNSANLAWSQQFSGNANLPVGASMAAATAVDGANNTKTNGYALSVNAGTSSTLTFDANGNMTSDGTNSYSWDAANRMIQITYPGTGNNSQFAYDGLDQNVQIVEYASSSLSSTKQFVWVKDKMRRYHPCEARNAGGTITAQYLNLGETITGTSYFYTKDFPGSVREMTNVSGSIQDQLAYDPFGRATQLQGTLSPDFQYAEYYLHARSSLNLTRTRAYDSTLGRFLTRDPIEEMGGNNLFAYVSNNPVNYSDPSGAQGLFLPIMPPPPALPFPKPVPASSSNASDGPTWSFCQRYCHRLCLNSCEEFCWLRCMMRCLPTPPLPPD